MLFLVFYFLLFLVLIFQGTHVAGEIKTPLGTLPEEVAQNPVAAARWGILLIAVGLLGSALGLLGFRSSTLAAARPGLLLVGLVVLALYGVWVIFLGRKPEFIGKPAVADDHGHGHH
jgi:ABC-type nickel/cobalt efflux system permease component RcnA